MYAEYMNSTRTHCRVSFLFFYSNHQHSHRTRPSGSTVGSAAPLICGPSSRPLLATSSPTTEATRAAMREGRITTTLSSFSPSGRFSSLGTCSCLYVCVFSCLDFLTSIHAIINLSLLFSPLSKNSIWAFHFYMRRTGKVNSSPLCHVPTWLVTSFPTTPSFLCSTTYSSHPHPHPHSSFYRHRSTRTRTATKAFNCPPARWPPRRPPPRSKGARLWTDSRPCSSSFLLPAAIVPGVAFLPPSFYLRCISFHLI